LLRRAPHGDEIESVTVRIVRSKKVEQICGRGAAGCYAGGRSSVLTVAAGKSRLIASTLLHEYGHHLDLAWTVDGVPEPNGTPLWWELRGIAQLRELGSVNRNYSLGWSRGIGEIFAEDYAYIALGRSYAIPWLYPPSRQLRRLLLYELQGQRPAVTLRGARTDTAIRPVTITGRGTLAGRASHVETFRLLGPGRRITLEASLSGAAGGRVEVLCNGALIESRLLPASRQATLHVRDVGPGSCRVVLLNPSAIAQRFSFRLRLGLYA
jgi:hypothetical protein